MRRSQGWYETYISREEFVVGLSKLSQAEWQALVTAMVWLYRMPFADYRIPDPIRFYYEAMPAKETWDLLYAEVRDIRRREKAKLKVKSKEFRYRRRHYMRQYRARLQVGAEDPGSSGEPEPSLKG